MFDVSVVIPNYNGERFLKEAIDSALYQKGVRVEVIVVDDGSTDKSKEILESFGEEIKVFYQENKGAPAARNLGWRSAKADYIKFLDSDDVLLPNILDFQLKLFAGLNEYEIPYGNAEWVDENLKPVPGYPLKPKLAGQDPILHILSQNPLTSSPLHKIELLKRIGGFDESLLKGQEFDLHLRLVIEGISFKYFNHKVYYFRQHSSLNRFSNNPLSNKNRAIYSMFLKQQQLIYKYYKGKVPENVKDVLARRSWGYGRAILQEGNFRKALLFFANANNLSKKIMDDRVLYRIATAIIGKIRTELILHKFKSLNF